MTTRTPLLLSFPLGIGRYLLLFRALDPFRLPAFSANAWRSILGMQLKRMSDGKASTPTRLPHGLSPEDLYTFFIESPPPADASMMRRYATTPPPYMLACPWRAAPRNHAAGEMLPLPLTLFGKANDLLGVVLLALSRGTAGGVGRERARLRLVRAESALPDSTEEKNCVYEPGGTLCPIPPWCPSIPPPPQSMLLRLTIESPLRLAARGRILPPGRLTPLPLMMNIIRRISALCAFYGSGSPDVDYAALKVSAGRMRLLEKDLHWHDQKRWSARTRTEVPMGGVMGTMIMDISAAPEVWPWLWFGQWLHAGKGTVLGLGRYTIA